MLSKNEFKLFRRKGERDSSEELSVKEGGDTGQVFEREHQHVLRVAARVILSIVLGKRGAESHPLAAQPIPIVRHKRVGAIIFFCEVDVFEFGLGAPGAQHDHDPLQPCRPRFRGRGDNHVGRLGLELPPSSVGLIAEAYEFGQLVEAV